MANSPSADAKYMANSPAADANFKANSPTAEAKYGPTKLISLWKKLEFYMKNNM